MHFKNKSITSRNEDISKWYTDICLKTGLINYSSVKGFIVYNPYSFEIWEKIKAYLNRKLKENNHENIYMPLVIPETLFNKEKEHVSGFAPETLIATIGGNKSLNEKLIIRPTSEALFSDFYSKIIVNYRDLPKLYNQWCSVVRWEKTTRPFLRGNEFLWQEGHTIHGSEKEAKKETTDILNIYDNLGKELLAIPFIIGKKSEKEKFAGAIETFTLETVMPDGKFLQCGTSHYFGQNFAKVFNINFLDKDNQRKIPFQTSWGISTRLIGALIMVHSDDNGLILPPKIAPIQAIIIPIQNNQKILLKAEKYEKILKKINVAAKIDQSNHNPGWKFAEWEMKGVPIMIVLGEKELKQKKILIIKRVDNKKIIIEENDLKKQIPLIFENIHTDMLKKAEMQLHEKKIVVETAEDFVKTINNNKYVLTYWCGNEKCEEYAKNINVSLRCILFDDKKIKNKVCFCCKKEAKHSVIFAKSY
ncbi:MAG: proline--tRNA ligase [Bacilli bacterium]|nr:proline--tRNA ligase [Bacilli bacterium]